MNPLPLPPPPGADADGCISKEAEAEASMRVRAQSHTNGAAARQTRHTWAEVTPPEASACMKKCGAEDEADEDEVEE